MAYSCCQNSLTDEEEFVPAIYVEQYLEKQSHESEYGHYLSCCNELGAKDARAVLDRMIVCDDIIANYDRHHRNFGIIRNIETLECRSAPIFDSGSPLWCNVATSELATGERSFEGKQFYASPTKQMLLVDDLSWFDISALKWRLERMIAIAKWN